MCVCAEYVCESVCVCVCVTLHVHMFKDHEGIQE